MTAPIPPDPAAEAPRPRSRVARTPGEPSLAPPVAREGGKTPRPAASPPPPQAGGAQDRENGSASRLARPGSALTSAEPGTPPSPPPSLARVAAGRPDPVTGARSPDRGRAPGRGRTKTPAGGGLLPQAGGADASPAGSQALSGAAWQKAAKAEQSRQGRERRRQAHRYTRIADRTAGSQFRPGMAVRKPPEPPDGAA
jgi:hypothetical protein